MTIKRKQGRLLVGVILGVLVYAIMVLASDAQATLGAMRLIGPGRWAIVLGLVLGNYALRFVKWHVYLRAIGLEIAAYPSALISLSGMVMSVTPGKLGEVFKSSLLKRLGGHELAKTAPVVLVERLTDLLGLALIGAIGAWALPFGTVILGVTLAGVCLGLAIINSPRLIYWGLGKLANYERLKGVSARLDTAYTSARALLGWRLLALTTLLSAASWSLEGVALWCFLDGLMTTPVSLTQALVVYALGTLAGALSLLPGGLVAMEAGLVGGLLALGLVDHPSQATAAATLIRLATLWFGVALGALALWRFERWMRAREASP